MSIQASDSPDDLRSLPLSLSSSGVSVERSISTVAPGFTKPPPPPVGVVGTAAAAATISFVVIRKVHHLHLL